MDYATYQELFNFFRAVAFQHSPALANDVDKCREVFHDYFLYRMINSPTDARRVVLKAMAGEEKSDEIGNLLYTVFLNAIRDFQRSQRVAYKHIDIDEISKKDDLPESDIEALQYQTREDPIRLSSEEARIAKISQDLFIQLSRDERAILTYIYRGWESYADLARRLGISKSATDRREKSLRRKIRGILGNLEPDATIEVFRQLFIMISDEGKNEE